MNSFRPDALIWVIPLILLGAMVIALAVVGTMVLVGFAFGHKQRGGTESSHLSQAQAALRASEARFALAAAGSSNGLWDWDVQTGSVYYAPRFQELLGFRAGEMENTFEAWRSRLHPEDEKETLAAVEAHLRQRRPFSHRYRLRRKQGDYQWFLATGQAHWDESGKATWMAGSITDISQQLVAEQERESSQLLYLSLVENLPVFLVRKDTAGRFTFANRAFCRLLGKSLEEILGTTDFDHYPKQLAEKYRKDDLQVIETGELFEDVEENIDATGQHYFEVLKTQVVDALGEVTGMQAIFWDVTDRKLAEIGLQVAKSAAEKANLAKSEFLANMSHEIRTPMNAIIGMTELVLESQLSPDQREYLVSVMEAGESLLTIINEILDFSKIEAGRMQLEAQPIELREMMGIALKSLGIRAHRKGIELIWQCEDDVPMWVIGDATRLRQILFNLVGNAIKFTHQGEVLVSVRLLAQNSESMQLEFVVVDSGIGIADAHRESIFDAFQQADTSTTRRYGGTGLGLAISRRLVELMGGELTVDSELGHGSTFRFQANFGVDSRQSPSVLPDTSLLHELSCLVVDDNATNRRILVEVLRKWGLTVRAVESGFAALEILRGMSDSELNGRIALPVLITDYNMPEMDGCMLCSEIRRDPKLKGMKIIVLSSSLGVAESAFGNLDIASFLYKPVKQSELFHALSQVVGAIDMAPETPLPESESMPALHVLLAEDGLANQKLAMGLLKRWGHTVTVVENGVDAVSAWADGSFDVILMDVQMPVMDGLEATRTIRAREVGSDRHIPIIAVTAHAMTGDREKCLDAGMDGYVTKPFKKQALADALRAWPTK